MAAPIVSHVSAEILVDEPDRIAAEVVRAIYRRSTRSFIGAHPVFERSIQKRSRVGLALAQHPETLPGWPGAGAASRNPPGLAWRWRSIQKPSRVGLEPRSGEDDEGVGSEPDIDGARGLELDRPGAPEPGTWEAYLTR
ncbi:hypothetical protein [Sorangium sp. So ce204]|uniref:hypothetical protein n=1 Tax=Sorangium sp. So ce204 TaxID=3133288 RepID=UPI003F629512